MATKEKIVYYQKVKCPDCGGKKCPVVNKPAKGVRWHKCRDCKTRFKSVEQD